MQFDFYLDTEKPRDGNFDYTDTAVELRYAFAEWGKLFLNPTLYGEYKFFDEKYGGDVFEGKLLLGDSYKNFHYGVNFVCEQELSQSKATELAMSEAISYMIRDSKLGVGIESKQSYTTESGSRNDGETEISIGPSVQWRITRKTHLDVVPLIGLTEDAADLETYIVFGYDFGQKSYTSGRINPLSTKGN